MAAEAVRSGFNRTGLQSLEMQESHWIPVAFWFLLSIDMSRE
jgi:hypothetical protein